MGTTFTRISRRHGAPLSSIFTLLFFSYFSIAQDESPPGGLGALQDHILHLSGPSISEQFIQYKNTHGIAPPAELQKQWHNQIASEQAEIIHTLPESVVVTSQLYRAVNAIKILSYGDEDMLDQLNALDQVDSVSEVVVHQLDLAYSVPWTKTDLPFELGIKGKGLKIGIIDSGVDYTHAALGGTGEPFLNNNPDMIEPGTFPNKVVVDGIDLVGDNYDPRSNDPQNRIRVVDPDPINLVNDHGTHVAGIAAGRPVGRLGGGVAPEADIYAVKVSSAKSPRGIVSVGEEAIEWILDPNQDFDLSDRLDVINMSFGGAYGEPGSPWGIALENAVAMGVIVAGSAGNSGNSPYVISAPSVNPGSISVAAASTGDVPFVPIEAFDLSAGKALIVPTGHDISEALAGETVVAPDDQCEPNENVAGKIVFVPRVFRQCLHTEFASVLKANGAMAMVIMESPDFSFQGEFTPSQANSVPVLVSNLTPAEIPAFVSLRYDRMFFDRSPDRIARFSSRGPHENYFKPEISAPGVSIVAALANTGNLGGAKSGTSMAAPHVAGAMALIKSVRPTWTPQQLKALLMNYADPLYNLDGTLLPLSRQGLGEINIARSIQAQSLAIPAGLSYGFSSLDEFKRIERQVTVHNYSDLARSYSLTLLRGQTLPGVHFDIPGDIWVEANSQRTITIAIHFNPFEMFGIEKSDFYEFDALIEFTSAGQTPFRVGVQAVIDPTAHVQLIHSNDESSTIYNHSQVEANVSAFLALNSITRRGTPPRFGGQLVTKSGREFLQLALAFDQPWKSPIRYLPRVRIDVDNDRQHEYEITYAETTAGDSVALIRDINTREILSAFLLHLPSFNSQIMHFEIPTRGRRFDFSGGTFDILALQPNSRVVSRSLIKLESVTPFNALPYNQTLSPYRELTTQIPEGKTLFWFVPEAEAGKEVLN